MSFSDEDEYNERRVKREEDDHIGQSSWTLTSRILALEEEQEALRVKKRRLVGALAALANSGGSEVRDVGSALVVGARAATSPGQSRFEVLPVGVHTHLVMAVGSNTWLAVVAPCSRALGRDLAQNKTIKAALRRSSMEMFRGGMELVFPKLRRSYAGRQAVVDLGRGSRSWEERGKELVARAAAAGLPSARAVCLCFLANKEAYCRKVEAYCRMAVASFRAQIDGRAHHTITEGSGQACSWSALCLADYYFHSHDVEEDEASEPGAKVVELYHHAVETDKNGFAMFLLAKVFEAGMYGKDVNLERARELYRGSAESGNFYGCKRLAEILERGELGAEARVGEALQWYEKAHAMWPHEWDEPGPVANAVKRTRRLVAEPLVIASRAGDVAELRRLISSRGADPNARGPSGQTPLIGES